MFQLNSLVLSNHHRVIILWLYSRKYEWFVISVSHTKDLFRDHSNSTNFPFQTISPSNQMLLLAMGRFISTSTFALRRCKKAVSVNWSKLGNFGKPRRPRQRERHKTKGLLVMSKTIALHVSYKSLYISLPSSANQEREMSKFCVVWTMRTTTGNFSYFHLRSERCHCIFSLSTFLEPSTY